MYPNSRVKPIPGFVFVPALSVVTWNPTQKLDILGARHEFTN